MMTATSTSESFEIGGSKFQHNSSLSQAERLGRRDNNNFKNLPVVTHNPYHDIINSETRFLFSMLFAYSRSTFVLGLQKTIICLMIISFVNDSLNSPGKSLNRSGRSESSMTVMPGYCGGEPRPE
jgi:hypothetical protein